MKSRKFLFALLVFITATALLVLGYIDADAWKAIAFLIPGGYFAANVTQKATEQT